MQQHWYECGVCHTKRLVALQLKYAPKPLESFETVCPICKQMTLHMYISVKKAKQSPPKKKTVNSAEQKMSQKQERLYAYREDMPWLRRALARKCKEYGFMYRFLYRSIIVTTPFAEWCFDYHLPRITLYHESTTKVNFETGNYARSHVQFRDRKMNPLSVIDFIATHEEWCVNHRTDDNRNLHSCDK